MIRSGDFTRRAWRPLRGILRRGRITSSAILAAIIIAFTVDAPLAQSQPGPFHFVDAQPQSGMNFQHTDGSSGRYYIVEYVSAGVALFDYDRDGWIDVYLLNGGRHPGTPASDTVPQDALYRNEGNWKFRDVTREAGLGDSHHGLGVTVGDYDNDGDQDLYLNNQGPNVLYRNNGDGTFTDVTAKANVADGDKVGAGACFLDIERDGDLDLYVANYVKFTYDTHVARTRQGVSVYASPLDYPPEPDTLFRNNGDGTFTDISDATGIRSAVAPGMGMVCADYDQDGDTDILVGNDSTANFLWQNDGHGHFTEVGLQAGFAYDMAGKVQGTMGVECADYDNDGRLDIHVTAFQNELATLYRNLGDGLFEDVTLATGAGEGTRAPVTWGNVMADFNNDGHRDLFMAAGHLDDQIDRLDDRTSYESLNLIFQNLGMGRFKNVSAASGPGLGVKRSSRGVGADDLDNDGDLDLVVLNSRREPTLLRNDSRSTGHWIQITLRGNRSNTDAVGARVVVQAGEQKWVDEVHSGRGYQGHFGSRLHFGLGRVSTIDQIQIEWPSGSTQTVTRPKMNQHLTIEEAHEK